jgi:long-chain acyl-CoA synthetase
MRRNVVSFLKDYERRGRDVAFAHRRGLRVERWSYARVASTARRLAHELKTRGVRKGDRVLLCAENSPEWVASFFGCALRGAVVVPLDAESAPAFISRVRRQTEPVLLLHDGAKHREVCDLPSLNLLNLEETLPHHASTGDEDEEITENDLLEIIYTSGTTTEPKGVLLTHGNLLASIAPLESEMQKYLKWERVVHPLRFLNSLPLSHVFGQLMSIFVPQLMGSRVFFQSSLNPSDIMETCRRERINVFVTIPRALELLRDRLERDAEREGRAGELHHLLKRAEGASVPRRLWAFRSLHRKFGWRFWAFIAGGATLSEETENFWQRAGFAVIQGYGMTETASLISVNHPFKKSRGSIGRTLPGQEVRLDESGEILVRGANVSPGYWAHHDNGSLKTEEGWLRTGDVGAIDEEGNLYFKGRKKDVIVTAAGLNIYPEDLEAALNAQPEVRESVVIPFEAQPARPEPLAVLIMKDAQANPLEVIERANLRLARHQQLRRHFIWPETDFPRTATQKVIKREVSERVLRELSAQAAANHEAGAVAELINRIRGDRQIQVASTSGLAIDLNLDSLDRVELLSQLEERYQVELDEAAFTSATTVGEVERMVKEGAAVEVGAQYPYPEWARTFPVTWIRRLLLYLFVLPLSYVMCRVRVRGLEHLKPLRAPVLFVSNHISMVDHALIIEALPDRFRRHLAIAMEGEVLRDWVRPQGNKSWLMRLKERAQYILVVTFFNVFPLPKKSGFRRSFAYAGEMMDRGQSVLVFPEGTRSEDGRMNPFMSGSGLLAAQLGVPVVPIKIDGLAELKLQNRRFARPHQVTITFGEAVSFKPSDDPARIAAEMQRRVTEL